MANWLGHNGLPSNPTNGNFNDATDWDTLAVPGASDDAVLGPSGTNPYTVTLSQDDQVNSISVGVGATLYFADGSLRLGADSTNNGTFLTDTKFSYIVSLTQGSALTNNGTIEAENGTGFYIDGLSNSGLIKSIEASVIQIKDVTNLASGVLTGGSWSASGTGSTMVLYSADGTPLSELGMGAIVTVSTPGSVFETSDNAGNLVSIEQSLTTIDSGARLQVREFRDYASSNALTINGVLQLGGGTYSGGNIEGAGLLTGNGTVSASIVGSAPAMMSAAFTPAVVAAGGSTLGVQAIGGTLVLTGDNDLSGALRGSGALEFGGGTDLLDTGVSVSVKTLDINGAAVTLGADVAFGKAFNMESGSLDVNGHTLTLRGPTTLSGGSVDASGGGFVKIAGSQAGLTTSGAITIGSNVTNQAADLISSGSLDIVGKVGGTGSFTFDPAAGSASLEFGDSVAAGQTINFNTDQAATLALDKANTFKGTLAGFAGSDEIDMKNVADSGLTLSYTANGAPGTLDVMKGAKTVAAIAFSDSHSASDFKLGPDAGTGTAITLV